MVVSKFGSTCMCTCAGGEKVSAPKETDWAVGRYLLVPFVIMEGNTYY